MTNKLIAFGKIQNDKLIYYNPEFHKIFSDFKLCKEDKEFELIISIVDTPKYFQHKYYRGKLLPAITKHSGEYDNYKQHILLKSEFLYEEIDDIKDIPTNQKESGIFIIQKSDLNSERLAKYPCSLIKGIILVMDENKLVGYIKSTSKLTYDEMKKYIILIIYYIDNGRFYESIFG